MKRRADWLIIMLIITLMDKSPFAKDFPFPSYVITQTQYDNGRRSYTKIQQNRIMASQINKDFIDDRGSFHPQMIISDFQVNVNSGPFGSNQFGTSMASDEEGNFVVTWWDERNGDTDIYAQRYTKEGVPLGSNFRVNDDNGCALQDYPSVAMDADGNFVITWCDSRNGDTDIYARIYSSDGTVMGHGFKVNDDEGDTDQGPPSISIAYNGDFVIVWSDDDYNSSVYAQMYLKDGMRAGNNVIVNDEENEGHSPAVSSDSQGNFIVVWAEYDFIHAQRFSDDGTALGGNFLVCDGTSVGNYEPAVSMNGYGEFVVTWKAYYISGLNIAKHSIITFKNEPTASRNDDRNLINVSTDTSPYYIIVAQRYSSDGQAVGSIFRVDDEEVPSYTTEPTVLIGDDNSFIIVWADCRPHGIQSHIYGKLYSSDGTPLGNDFQMDDDFSEWNFHPSIIKDIDGNYIVTWQKKTGVYDRDIYMRHYDGSGTPLGDSYRVNDDTVSVWQYNPSIAVDDSGNFLIAWDDAHDGDYDVYAQRYSHRGEPLGNNFKVNEDNTKELQKYPSIGVNYGEGFMIAWYDSRKEDPHDYGDIYAQRYSDGGDQVGGNFKVNDDLGDAYQYKTDVAVFENGNYIIVWEDDRDNRNSFKIYAQLYSSDFMPLGDNFLVNDNLSGRYGRNPSVASDKLTYFIIVWNDGREDNKAIYGRLFHVNGTPHGQTFKIYDYELSLRKGEPCVSMSKNGNFIVTWEDNLNGNYDIYAQWYARGGYPRGSNFKVNDDEGDSSQRHPSVSMNENGNYIIVWDDDRDGINPEPGEYIYDRLRDSEIYAQRYSSDGEPYGSNFRITSSGLKSQRFAKVKLWKNRIYTTWEDSRAGGSGFDIWANVLDWDNPKPDPTPDPIPSFNRLYQNYPNPFNQTTTICFHLSKEEFVELKIYDILGTEIEILISESYLPGEYRINWIAEDLPSGIYLYRLSVGDYIETKKMVLQR